MFFDSCNRGGRFDRTPAAEPRSCFVMVRIAGNAAPANRLVPFFAGTSGPCQYPGGVRVSPQGCGILLAPANNLLVAGSHPRAVWPNAMTRVGLVRLVGQRSPVQEFRPSEREPHSRSDAALRSWKRGCETNRGTFAALPSRATTASGSSSGRAQWLDLVEPATSKMGGSLPVSEERTNTACATRTMAIPVFDRYAKGSFRPRGWTAGVPPNDQ
jgi:hypothetical protein